MAQMARCWKCISERVSEHTREVSYSVTALRRAGSHMHVWSLSLPDLEA